MSEKINFGCFVLFADLIVIQNYIISFVRRYEAQISGRPRSFTQKAGIIVNNDIKLHLKNVFYFHEQMLFFIKIYLVQSYVSNIQTSFMAGWSGVK